MFAVRGSPWVAMVAPLLLCKETFGAHLRVPVNEYEPSPGCPVSGVISVFSSAYQKLCSAEGRDTDSDIPAIPMGCSDKGRDIYLATRGTSTCPNVGIYMATDTKP